MSLVPSSIWSWIVLLKTELSPKWRKLRHSTMYLRFGALPITSVKIGLGEKPAKVACKSSQLTARTLFGAAAVGRIVLFLPAAAPGSGTPGPSQPLLLRVAVV